MIPTFALKFDLPIQKTNIDTQNIDDLALQIYKMTTTRFLVYNKLDRVWFFEKTFLLANTSIKMILEMLFLFFSNANI